MSPALIGVGPLPLDLVINPKCAFGIKAIITLACRYASVARRSQGGPKPVSAECALESHVVCEGLL